jgi:sugar-specific transcriptional regulator TrmB
MADDLRTTMERVGERFDFGEYEVDAYLTVLEHGELTAAGIADNTDIPQPRVYDTVRSLADHGFVELIESRPMKVLALEPETVFDDVRSSLDDLVAGLQRQYTSPARGDEAVSLVKSRSTILRYIGDVVESAEYELVVSLTPELVEHFEAELRERRAAGINIELLVAPAGDAAAPEEYNYDAIATTTFVRRGVTTPIVALADGAYTVYATQEALRNDRDRYGVIFNRSELGFLVSGFLDTVVLATARTVHESEADRPFPRRYASIRRCVDDLRAVDDTLHASVEGRDVETGEDRRVSGRITDVSVGTNREMAALTIEGGDGVVDVGGQAAALEEIEARTITVDRGSPPPL